MENRFDVNHPLARDIMSDGVYRIDANLSINDAIKIMFEKRISAVLTSQGDENFIITNKDLIDFLYHNNQGTIDLDKIPCSQIMSGPLELMPEDTPLDEIIQYMFVKGFKRIIIGHNNKPKGIISNTDILMWNAKYFQPAKPLVFAIMDNDSNILIGFYVFEENIRSINRDLLDLIGGALGAISNILSEAMNQSGRLRELEKDDYIITFEPREFVTGIIISDKKSITIRHKLHYVTNAFCDWYLTEDRLSNNKKGIQSIDISRFAKYFRKS
jgi:CBS domain-containing protein